MPKVEIDTDKIVEFHDKLLKDKKFRGKFAADPKAVLKEEGIEVPEELIPEKVDLEALEQRAAKATAVAATNVIPIAVWP